MNEYCSLFPLSAAIEPEADHLPCHLQPVVRPSNGEDAIPDHANEGTRVRKAIDQRGRRRRTSIETQQRQAACEVTARREVGLQKRRRSGAFAVSPIEAAKAPHSFIQVALSQTLASVDGRK